MLTRQEVLKIAQLARLSLTDAEVAEYQKRLGRVIEYMKDLDSLSLPKGAFVRHVPLDAPRFREDEARQWPDREAIVANAPLAEENQFLLPTVLEKET
ncbi:MAG: Asp-tRNA(Asn)/Glu-tRNA(Gln) amidotransferase subunit GatC [Deltaproteobacteria bacterium]|nr:Asp-tRNA(Asn)/Glu-tRNA(Gln) amidotransferase subunit GatC [Deltaproteobacteria bacterium]MBI3293641.1 Asp-tRNA(Asn)/Glu-tRNA(Gln) amidotransferase subunit GatC [Deltaproteobacteria bacterium]